MKEAKYAQKSVSLRHVNRNYAVILAVIPALALTAALPLVNRIEPVVFGLPFLLFWITAWVAATPGFLWLAYLLVRQAGRRSR